MKKRMLGLVVAGLCAGAYGLSASAQGAAGTTGTDTTSPSQNNTNVGAPAYGADSSATGSTGATDATTGNTGTTGSATGATGAGTDINVNGGATSSGSGMSGTTPSGMDNTAPTPDRTGDFGGKHSRGTDRQLNSQIREALGQPDTASMVRNLKVSTRRGKVTLRGTVRTQADKDSLTARAAAIAGGEQNVNNEIKVDESSFRTTP